jgi:hypothetical protein
MISSAHVGAGRAPSISRCSRSSSPPLNPSGRSSVLASSSSSRVSGASTPRKRPRSYGPAARRRPGDRLRRRVRALVESGDELKVGHVWATAPGDSCRCPTTRPVWTVMPDAASRQRLRPPDDFCGIAGPRVRAQYRPSQQLLLPRPRGLSFEAASLTSMLRLLAEALKGLSYTSRLSMISRSSSRR